MSTWEMNTTANRYFLLLPSRQVPGTLKLFVETGADPMEPALSVGSSLTPDEARVLARALLAKVDEAEKRKPKRKPRRKSK